MNDPIMHLFNLPAVIKALSDVPPERQKFVGLMIMLLTIVVVVPSVCLFWLMH